MKIFGSITELVAAIFRKNSQTITVRPNQTTTYTAARDVQLPEQDSNAILVSRNSQDTLLNKTLTSPAITTPTGLVKADVGLGNVDNTSDATKNAASVTLTNKKLEDATTTIVDSVDPTKVIAFDAGGTTGTSTTFAAAQTANRVLTAPDASDTLAGISAVQVLTNKDIDGGTASNTSRLTVPKAATAALNALTRKAGTIVYDTSVSKPYYDDGSTLRQIGTGSGSGKNYLSTFFDFDTDPTLDIVTTLTATGNRTASTTKWGSSTTALLSYETAAPLRSPGSAKFTLIGAAGAQFVESPMFTLDSIDVYQKLYMSFDSYASSGGHAIGDIDVVLIRYNSSGTYQETIKPSRSTIFPGNELYKSNWVGSQTASDQYAVRWRSQNAASRVLTIDSLLVGPVQQTMVQAVSPLALEPFIDVSIGTVGSAPQLATYGSLGTADFPTPANAHVYGLNSDSNDANGTPLNLTQSGSPAFTRNGFFGRENIMTFDGVDDYLFTNNSTHFNPTDATSWTLGCWVKAKWQSKTSGDAILCILGGNTSTDHVSIYVSLDFSSSKNFQILRSTGGALGSSNINNAVNFKSFQDDEWLHFVLVRVGSGALSLYINGQLAATTASQTLENSSSNYISTVGRDSNSATNYFPGEIQDFFLASGEALTASQVNVLYSKRFKGAQQQLAGGHVLDASSFPLTSLTNKVSGWNLQALTDFSGNGKTLTNGGSTPFTGLSIFGTANIAKLNGSSQYFTSADSFFNPGNIPFSYGGWFAADNWAPASPQNFVINIGGSHGWALRTDTGGITYYYGTGAPTISTGIKPVNGSWHHIASVYDGTTWTLYVDGIAVDSRVNSNTAAGGIFTMGAYNGGASQFFAGRMQDVFFTNNLALTAQDIQKLVASKLTLNTSVVPTSQDWKASVYSEDGQYLSELSDSFITSKSASALFMNWGGGSASRVNLKMFDSGTSTGALPAVNFDRTYTSQPGASIVHQLPSIPTNVRLLHNTLADGKFEDVTAAFTIKTDATSIYLDVTSLTIDATHELRVIAGVGASNVTIPNRYKTVTSAWNAVAGDKLYADSSGGSFTITLPSSPGAGDDVEIFDPTSSWVSFNVTVARNGQPIQGIASDLVLDVNGGRARLIYYNTTQGWRVFQ